MRVKAGLSREVSVVMGKGSGGGGLLSARNQEIATANQASGKDPTFLTRRDTETEKLENEELTNWGD